MGAGRPYKFSSAEDLQAGIDAYFAECDAQDRPYTMSGLARALGCASATIRNYQHEEWADAAIVGAVKSARQRVEQWTEERLYGKGHPAGPIFSLKNNFGWKDTQEVAHTHTMIVIGAPGARTPQLEPPVIVGEVVSPPTGMPIALSPAREAPVSDASGEAKAPPIEGVSPVSVA
jgi:hypothetical protein